MSRCRSFARAGAVSRYGLLAATAVGVQLLLPWSPVAAISPDHHRLTGGRNCDAFGQYPLQPAPSTSMLPFSAQCKLEMTFPDGSSFAGSGTLIGPRYVLTAAHNVYKPDHQLWAKTILVTPGLNGAPPPGDQVPGPQQQPFGSAQMKRERTFQEYLNSLDLIGRLLGIKSEDWDLALITLDRDIGAQTRWLDYVSSLPPDGADATLSGYPAENGYDGLHQYYSSGPIDRGTDTQVFYRMDAYAGDSGAAIYYRDKNGWHVFAVHNGGNSGGNYGCRITPQKFVAIQSWVAGGG